MAFGGPNERFRQMVFSLRSRGIGRRRAGPDTPGADTNPPFSSDAEGASRRKPKRPTPKRIAEPLADIVGGRKRLEAIAAFGARNFLPEPERTELAASAARVRAAQAEIDGLDAELASGSGSDEAPKRYRPRSPRRLLQDLAELDEKATRALGPKIPKPAAPDPDAGAGLPYLNRGQLAADKKRANAEAKAGVDVGWRHRIIEDRIRQTHAWKADDGEILLARADLSDSAGIAAPPREPTPSARDWLTPQARAALDRRLADRSEDKPSPDPAIMTGEGLAGSRAREEARRAAEDAFLLQEVRKDPGFKDKIRQQNEAYAGVFAQIDGVDPGFPRNIRNAVLGVPVPDELVGWMKANGFYREDRTDLQNARRLKPEARWAFYEERAAQQALPEARARLHGEIGGARLRGVREGDLTALESVAEGALDTAAVLLDPKPTIADLARAIDPDLPEVERGLETHAWLTGRTPEEVRAARQQIRAGLSDAVTAPWSIPGALVEDFKERAAASGERERAVAAAMARFRAGEISREALLAEVEKQATGDAQDDLYLLALSTGAFSLGQGARRQGEKLKEKLEEMRRAWEEADIPPLVKLRRELEQSWEPSQRTVDDPDLKRNDFVVDRPDAAGVPLPVPLSIDGAANRPLAQWDIRHRGGVREFLKTATKHEIETIYDEDMIGHTPLEDAMRAEITVALIRETLENGRKKGSPALPVLPLSRLNKLRDLGFSIDQITSTDFAIDAKRKMFVDMNDRSYRWSHEMANPRSPHFDPRAKKLSDQMMAHFERAIDGVHLSGLPKYRVMELLAVLQSQWLVSPRDLPRGLPLW